MERNLETGGFANKCGGAMDKGKKEGRRSSYKGRSDLSINERENRLPWELFPSSSPLLGGEKNGLVGNANKA